MRDWGRLRHNDHSLWWSILARNKRSVALNLREPRGQEIAADLAATRRHRARELPPRHDGEVGPRAGGRARAQPALRSTPASPATARPAATATARASPPPARRSPACATSTATPTRRRRAAASASATRSPPSPRSRASCSRSTPASAAPRARSWTRASSTPASRCSSRRRSSTRRPASSASRPGRGCRASRRSNVYCSKDGKWVVIAANHDTLWRRLATLMGQPELGEDERFATHHARGEHEDLLDEIIGEFAAPPHGRRARRDHQRGRRRLRAGLHGAGRLRGPALPRARAARGARGRGPRARSPCRGSCRS